VELVHHRLELPLYLDRFSIHARDATRGHASTLPVGGGLDGTIARASMRRASGLLVCPCDRGLVCAHRPFAASGRRMLAR
jgi:hypothetical protein